MNAQPQAAEKLNVELIAEKLNAESQAAEKSRAAEKSQAAEKMNAEKLNAAQDSTNGTPSKRAKKSRLPKLGDYVPQIPGPLGKKAADSDDF